jgi:acyl-ACP thioesterase
MKKLVEKRVLKTYQTDRFGNIRPLILMNELQAIADSHAEILGCGRSYCIENGIAWVVTHYLVDIIESPKEAEELTFTTWPSAGDGLRATRDFTIHGADGRQLVRATSQWIMIDLETRRPVRLTDRVPHWDVISERAWDRTFEKFADFDAAHTHEFDCRYDDIDVNQHINNAVYAVWATESVGFEFRNTHQLAGIELNFKKEIAPNIPNITVGVSIDGMTSRHKITTGDTENANIICRWK